MEIRNDTTEMRGDSFEKYGVEAVLFVLVCLPCIGKFVFRRDKF